MTDVRPAGRFEWEQSVLRGRWTGLVKGNGNGTRGGVSGAVFRAVAWALCTHADADGSNVRPGDATVAVLAEVGVKNVRAVRSTLVALGFLTKVRVGPRRLGGGDVYCLTLPQGAAGVTVLSPAQIKSEGQRVSDGTPARRKRTGSGGSEAVVLGPLDPVETAVVPGPLDMVKDVVLGPADRVESGCTGSSGPPEDGCTGSRSTVVPGPVDRHTNHDQPTTTNSASAADAKREARAQRDGALFANPPRIPERLRLIFDTLSDDAVTVDEARAVEKAWIAAAHPNGIGLYRLIAREGGIPWRSILADVRTAAKAASLNKIAELKQGPRCPHGEPGGDQPHPRTGEALCVGCRRGMPAAETSGPQPVETYRRLYLAAHNERPAMPLMSAVAGQRHDLAHKHGVDARALDALAAAAALNGHDLITELRAQKERASA